jgi:NMD protein affecting ribosome stability and mRNA decay
MNPNAPAGAPARSGRRIAGRAQRDHAPDPYQAQQKLPEPTACRQCGAVYHRGRWQWGPKPEDAHEALCPACRRIKEHLPAGIITVRGSLATRHRDEIIALARHAEAAEKPEHPMNRIAAIEQTDEGLVITTTDIHLPRRIGEAVKHAYPATLDIQFDPENYFVRVFLD